MKIKTELVLLGVVGKKGSGTLDNGNAWATDRVELHCIDGFDSADSMAHGETVVVHQVQDYSANYERAKASIGQLISLELDIQPAKKLGQAPRISCMGFSVVKGPMSKTGS